MAWVTVLGVLSVSWTIPSSFLCCLIYMYITKKPPGHQSVLDLVIMEYLVLSIIRNIVSVVYHYIGLFHAPIELNIAEFLYFIVVSFPRFEIASIQTILVIKAVLIFKGEWLADLPDFEVIWISRKMILVYSSLTFLIDFCQTPKSFPAWKLLTGSDQTDLNT